MNKKGNINQLFPAILALVLVGVLIVLGIQVLEGFQATTYTSASANVINETLARASTAGITLATGAATKDYACGSLVQVLNGTTGNVVIQLANFTQTNCLVKNATDLAAGGYTATLRYSYPYTFNNITASTNAIASTHSALETVGSTWLPIIIVVIAAGIVLGILLGAFGGKKK